MAYGEPRLFDTETAALSIPHKTTPAPMTIRVSGQLLETTAVFESYWRFAAERQKVFLRKVGGSNSGVLTSDPILSAYKFTNAYRASDRVSQYLIRNVIYRKNQHFDTENTFFRILLFKLFNKIETWEALESEFGEITLDKYSFELFDEFLSARQDNGVTNYSAAYIMPSAGRVFGFKRKHSNHLKLLEWMIQQQFPQKLSNFDLMEDGFNLFASAPSFGPFLAYQYITDVNYSNLTEFSEREFVVAGPGALDGISKCFVDTKGTLPQKIIQHMTRYQHEYFQRWGIQFNDLWGRELQLIDCQNLFCEISKYSRVSHPDIVGVSGRIRIKQKYRSSGANRAPWYPPKWGINDKIDISPTYPLEISDDASAVQYTLF